MITKSGIIKKTPLEEFSNIRKSGIIAITLKEDDELISVRQSSSGDEFILVSAEGKAIRFSEKDVRSMGRSALGVRAIALEGEDEVVAAEIASDDKYLLVISENGFGKMTKLDEYKVQNRSGKGLITYKIKDKTGKIISAKVIDRKDEVMMITEEGIIIRLETEGISILGRNTSGVKLMNIKDSKIVAVAKYIGD